MKLLCVILFLVFNYACGSGSVLPSSTDPIAEEIQDKFFPDVEYPQTVQETSRVFFKPIGILDPFSEEVKSSYKSIAETSKNYKQEANIPSSSEIDALDSETELQNTSVSSGETKDEEVKEIANNIHDKSTNTDTLDCSLSKTSNNNETDVVQSYYTDSNTTMGNENSEKSTNETEAISPDTADTANIANETTAEEIESEDIHLESHDTMTGHVSEPVETVLIKPPSANGEDDIAVVETEDEDCIIAPDCEEKCVIEKIPVDDQ
uniref:Uncharacterized protein n=1 Tax=Pectinophora gossypiella TaxID=13191 RepID=A0A1E1W5Q8_PECGO